MSLASQAAKDMKANLNIDGDEVKFTPPGEAQFSVICKTARVDMQTDPGTGVKFFEPKTHVTVSLTDLLPHVPDPEGIPWELETVDQQGNTVKLTGTDLLFDRSINFVTFIGEAYEAV